MSSNLFTTEIKIPVSRYSINYLEDISDTSLYTNEIKISVNEFKMDIMKDTEDVSDAPNTSILDTPKPKDYKVNQSKPDVKSANESCEEKCDNKADKRYKRGGSENFSNIEEDIADPIKSYNNSRKVINQHV